MESFPPIKACLQVTALIFQHVNKKQVSDTWMPHNLYNLRWTTPRECLKLLHLNVEYHTTWRKQQSKHDFAWGLSSVTSMHIMLLRSLCVLLVKNLSDKIYSLYLLLMTYFTDIKYILSTYWITKNNLWMLWKLYIGQGKLCYWHNIQVRHKPAWSLYLDTVQFWYLFLWHYSINSHKNSTHRTRELNK